MCGEGPVGSCTWLALVLGFLFSLLVQHLHTNLTKQNRNKNTGSHNDLLLNAEIVMSHIKSQQRPQFR